MKLTAQIKLHPTDAQVESLKRTLEAANAAANYLSAYAWNYQQFRKYDLHYAGYYAIREEFGLSAQVAVRIVAKVADSYKLDRQTQRTFRPLGSIAYDDRILSWKKGDTVSIWSLDGRLTIPFVCGETHRELLTKRQGEADLVYRNGEFYLYQTCDVDETPLETPADYLGIDLGVATIAADSDEKLHSGSEIKNVRFRHRRLRSKLQKKGTKSCRRRLRKLSGKERRFATQVNHTISKQIVDSAQRTGRGIALEDLQGIRDRIRARRSQRATLHSWSFYQLRGFIEYKAKRVGVVVVAVDPRNTSRTCPSCGCIDKANRPNQATFLCIQCGFSGHADCVAAENIRRAAVNQPYVSTTPNPA